MMTIIRSLEENIEASLYYSIPTCEEKIEQDK